MQPLFRILPRRNTWILACALSFALAVTSATPVRAQQAGPDAEFLKKAVPSIASSVTIIDYAVKNGSDPRVREFAERVLKQHKESVEIAKGHARRLDVAVVTDPDKESKETLTNLTKLKGSGLDVAFLEWLSHIHHDTTLFETEITNGADPELKIYAKNSIAAGNEHLKEARELLARLKAS